MIRHIIMFKFIEVQNDSDKLEKAERIKATFSPLRDSINVVKKYEVVINSKKTEFSYDVAIISEYSSWEDLNTYLNHPEHQKAISLCKDLKKKKLLLITNFKHIYNE